MYNSPTLEKRQFFAHWRWVHIRECEENKHQVKILGGDTRRPPNLPSGAIYCPHKDCNSLVKF